MNKHVVVGLSGGVDSAVTAYLLKKEGYTVSGVTMQTLSGNGSPDGDPDARAVAEMLDIPYYTARSGDLFRGEVIDYFIREYENGRTPNPCVFCNPSVKWQSLLSMAQKLGADFVATGHYAQVIQLPDGRMTLKMGEGGQETGKDQTYALSRLTQEQLSKTMMPLGAMTKDMTRAVAAEAGLPVAEKPDSQEICFIPDGDYAAYIENISGKPSPEGNFVDEEGRVLGRHSGLIRYTVGQRKGLGVSFGRRMFVKELRPETNEVVLSDNDSLFLREVFVDRLHFMGVPDLEKGGKLSVYAKIRYNHKAASGIIERTGEDEIMMRFDEPQRAVTPGQAAVFYIDGWIACSGIIKCGR